MDHKELSGFKKWFAGYCASFAVSHEEDQGNFALKEQHTHDVCANIVRIAADLSLDGRRSLLAEVIALFHDVGRFPQYQKFRTFNDRSSANHAALGAKVLLEHRVLDSLPKRDRELVVHVVAMHNVFSLPDSLDNDTLLLLRMVRDADKIDIMRVMIAHCGRREEERSAIVGLGLPDAPGYSAEILARLENREMVRMSSLKALNDFKLLQLAWIYDLNFTSSLRMVKERAYVLALAAMLPPVDEISRAVMRIQNYVDEKIRDERAGNPVLKRVDENG